MIIMSKDKKEYKTWKKSVEKDSVHKSVSVKEAENGFIVKVCESNYGEEYSNNEKIFISTKNPLEGEKEYTEEIDATDEIMKAIEALNID